MNTPMPADCSGSTDLAWKYTYDADGNQLSQTDPRNQSTYTTYDALDRPLCRALTSADASSCNGSTDAVFFYDGYSNASTPGATFPSGCVAPSGSYASDPVGRKTAEIFIGTSGAGSGWRCYGYDARGQTGQSTLSVTTPDAGSVTQTVNMTYNDGGEVTGLVYPDGETLTSTYDVNGRLHSIYFGTPGTTDPVAFLVGQMTYTDAGQVAGMAIGGTGPKASVPTPVYATATTYDGLQRPLSNTITEAGQTVWSQTRTYDNVGNVLGLSTVIPTQGGGTATENESFCYDALNRLVWAGNSGTPTGGDHCMAPPTGTTLPTYTQAYSYDSLDRLTSGSAGTYTYGDANQVHAVTGISSEVNQYAAYDAMGNMICRNTDATSAHTCAGSSPTGAAMTYDAHGQLTNWTAPSGTVGSAHYLYDAEGNRVLTNSSNAGTTTDTIYFDGYTETVLTGGTTTTTRYYSANGARVAVRIGSSTLDYLMSDPLGSNSVALNNLGQVIAIQHYSPYGTGDYSWGTMPTSFNYAGERLDSQTGLLYDNFRYYDPLVGRFVRSDDVVDNSTGSDPYAYVGDDPETRNDPTGHAGTTTCNQCIEEVISEAEQRLADLWNDPTLTPAKAAAAISLITLGLAAVSATALIVFSIWLEWYVSTHPYPTANTFYNGDRSHPAPAPAPTPGTGTSVTPHPSPTPTTSSSGAMKGGGGGVGTPFCGGLSVCSDLATRAIQYLYSQPNTIHHAFDFAKHNWYMTGLSLDGNINLIGQVIEGNYATILAAGSSAVEIKGNFGLYNITVTGFFDASTGLFKISNAWVNAGNAK